MKKLFKSFLALTLACVIFATLFSMTAFAANSVIIAFSPNKTLTPGESLVVTVTINTDEAMYGVGCIVNYDAEKFSYESGNATGGAGSLKIIESPSGETRVSYQLTFKALAAGSAAFAVTDCNYETLAESKSLTGASASISITDVTLSGNANLSALTVSSGNLSPKFSASRTSYSVNVPNSVTQFTVYATAADSAATVNVPATTNLKIGKNTINVAVTAPDGTQKTYTITVTRSEEEVSEPETSEPDVSTPEEDLEILINGTEYITATDISGITLPAGFSASTATYKGSEVPVAEDAGKKYTIYYLAPKDSSDFAPFTYDEDKDEFKPVLILNRNNRMYIVEDIPDSDDIPDAYYMTNTTIDTLAIKCLRRNGKGFEDFCYIYCYIDGKSQFYKYDTVEDSLQRYPEFSLGVPDSKPAVNTDNDSFKDRFASLNGNQKIVAIAFVIIVLIVIVLIVLLIKKVFGKKDTDDDELFDYEEDDEKDEIEEIDEIDDEEFDEVKITNASDEEEDI